MFQESNVVSGAVFVHTHKLSFVGILPDTKVTLGSS